MSLQANTVQFVVYCMNTMRSSPSPDLEQFLEQLAHEARPGDRLPTIRELMKRFGASQDQIDKALDEANKKDNFSFSSVMLGFAFSCFIYFLFSLIIALIVRKKNPENQMPQTM